MGRGADRYEDYEDRVRSRPNPRGTRPRTKDRPAHEDAVDGRLVGIDRGRYAVLVADRAVTAMKARELARKGIVVGDDVALVGDVSGSADALAHERCKLLVIAKDDFDDLLFLNKDLAYEVLWSSVRMLTSRLRETNEKLTFLSVSGKF